MTTMNVKPLSEQPRVPQPKRFEHAFDAAADGSLDTYDTWEPINVNPAVRADLRKFLMYGPGAGTGIGYSEFIAMSMRLWEKVDGILPLDPDEIA